MNAEAVVFDLGGVLTTSPMPSLARFLADSGVPQHGVYEWFTNPDGAWANYETGRLDQHQVLAPLELEAAEQGLSLDVGGFVQAFFAGFAVRERMVRAVDALKGKRVIACLTNTVKRDGATEFFGLDRDRLFDVVVASCEVGMRKPNPAIYELTCRRLDMAPASVFFLDDYEPNVSAAVRAGLSGVLFRSEEQAIDELRMATGIPLHSSSL
jgi:putative hydrolase of the HAD superfamily